MPTDFETLKAMFDRAGVKYTVHYGDSGLSVDDSDHNGGGVDFHFHDDGRLDYVAGPDQYDLLGEDN